MHPAIKAALHRLGTVLLATVAGGAMQAGQPARQPQDATSAAAWASSSACRSPPSSSTS